MLLLSKITNPPVKYTIISHSYSFLLVNSGWQLAFQVPKKSFVPPLADTKYAHPSRYGHVGKEAPLFATPFRSQPFALMKVAISISDNEKFAPALAIGTRSVPIAGAQAVRADIFFGCPLSTSRLSFPCLGEIFFVLKLIFVLLYNKEWHNHRSTSYKRYVLYLLCFHRSKRRQSWRVRHVCRVETIYPDVIRYPREIKPHSWIR